MRKKEGLLVVTTGMNALFLPLLLPAICLADEGSQVCGYRWDLYTRPWVP